MQYRRDADCLADLAESLRHDAILIRDFRCHETGLGDGLGSAPGHDNQAPVLDEFPHHLHVHRIVGNPGVVAADHADHPADAAVDDAVVQGAVGSTEPASQHVVYVLVIVPGYEVAGLTRYLDLAPVGEIVDSHLHDLPGGLKAVLLVKLDELGERHLRLAAGGDHLGVVALGELTDSLVDALHVHHHGIHRAGDYGELLLEHVPRDRDAVPREYLVRGTADAGDVDTFGAFLLGLLDHLFALAGEQDHLRQDGLVAVHDDVDLFLGEHTQVYLGPVSYTHLRAHETRHDLVCRLLLEK